MEKIIHIWRFLIFYYIGIYLANSQFLSGLDLSSPKRFFQSLSRRQFKEMENLKEKCTSWDNEQDCKAKNMMFYKHPLKGCESLGFCDCDQGFKKMGEGPCSGVPIRMRLFYPETGQCYPVFAQGPCKVREWLIMDEKILEPKCVHNPCFPRGFNTNSSSSQFWFWHPNRKQCYQSLTPGYCPHGETLELVHESQYPQCKKQSCHALLSVRSPLACRAGTRYSRFLGSCSRTLRLSPRSQFG